MFTNFTGAALTSELQRWLTHTVRKYHPEPELEKLAIVWTRTADYLSHIQKEMQHCSLKKKVYK